MEIAHGARAGGGPPQTHPAPRPGPAGGTPVELSAREYALLTHLASDPRRVFTKHELLRDVWGFRSPGQTRTLDSYACRLRRKLTSTGDARFVENVWGVGYRLAGLALSAQPHRGGGGAPHPQPTRAPTSRRRPWRSRPSSAVSAPRRARRSSTS